MHKTGRVAIGNVNMAVPLAKLHIRADAGEDAAILIEPNTWNTGAEAHLLLGNANNGISVQKQVEGADLLFRSERNYLFNSTGYLGINTLEPQYNLHVEGSMFTKSFRLYNDALPPIEEGFVLVADEFGNAYWGNPTTVSLWQLNGNGNDIYYMGGKWELALRPRKKCWMLQETFW
ncbi:MAG: hypothetical protein L3J66_01305 [Bacteroidales bacterium]|nr:hypothetical protein [Bacteroidales bacterium]